MTSAYTSERVTANKQNSITPKIINKLNTALSKTGKSVLIALYRTPQIQQKVLAVNINTTPNSLSNLLNKMEAINPQLLHIEHVGRSKYYSLTEIAEQYVISELIHEESYNINTFFSISPDTSLFEETLRSLHQFQNLAGKEWPFILYNMLINDTNVNRDHDELYNLYTQFIINMKQMYAQKESRSLHKIYDELSNSTLTDKLENYLKSSLGDSHALTPLFDLEKLNSKKAIELINYAFAEIRPQIFGKDDLSLFPQKELPVSEAQYNAIFHDLSIMVNEFADCHKSKLQILKNWEKKLSASNISLYFIAEKCNTIYLKESEKHSS